MKKQLLTTITLALIISGCGSDPATNEKVKELQQKALNQDQEIATLKEKVNAQESLLKNLSTEVTRSTELVNQLRSQTDKRRQAVATQQSRSKTAQRVAALASAKGESPVSAKREASANKSKMELMRLQSMTQALINHRSLGEIVSTFNERKIAHPGGGNWSEQKLATFIRQHNIRRTRTPAPTKAQ